MFSTPDRNHFYQQIEPRDIPTYSIGDAARYLRIPSSTIRAWTVGQAYPVKDGSNFFAPLIAIRKNQKPYLLSFINLIEIHVLRAIRQHHRIELNIVRTALDFIEDTLHIDRPLATQKFSTDGVDLFIDRYGQLICASQQERRQLKHSINTHLERIEPDDTGLAIKLYPFTHADEENKSRIVVLDPRVAFGRLTIDGTGISTDILKERFVAGDSIDDLAKDYDCSRLSIEEAIRCEFSPLAA